MRVSGFLGVEWKVTCRSRWTWIILTLVVCALLFACLMTLRLMGQNNEAVGLLQTHLGSDSVQSFVNDPDALAGFRDTQPSHGVSVPLAILAALGPFLVAAWGAGLIGSEISWRTNRVRAAHFGWGPTVLAKMVLVVGGCACIAIVAGLLGLAWKPVMSHAISTRYPLLALVPLEEAGVSIFAQMGAVFSGLACYGLLASLLVLALRSTPAALVGTVALIYVGGFIHAPWIPSAAFAELLSATLSYPAGIVGAPDQVPGGLGPWWALAVLLAWSCAFGLGAWAIAKRQEVR
ncbi:MAG: hypothetical protein GX113_01620 [Actinobacteria bacterium]|jgi:ABC-type transport system involved in multi-copper enzyme maturation permease subunit|nr:hypothetical protein [Actinomycetota bacterium]